MNDKKRDPIEEALDLPSYDEEENLPSSTEEENTSDDQQNHQVEIYDSSIEEDETVKDIELARANIKNIINTGDDSLKDIIDLAKQSESPRAFEVASNMMKMLLDANKDFIDTSVKKKETKDSLNPNKPTAGESTNVTNNNLILSTADILKMLKGDDEKQ